MIDSGLQSAFADVMESVYAKPRDMTPSVWAEHNRILDAAVTAYPGPWHNDRTPYLRAIMDAAADPCCEQIVVQKATQVGWSEALRNILGYWIDCEPGPCLWVMPSESTARATMQERLQPLIESSPALARHMTGRSWDMKALTLKLDSMSIYIGWAGSPDSLASRPCRYAILDEVDKYPAWSGREADPVRLALERLSTYGSRKKSLIGSTPTVREGTICRYFTACPLQRDIECPCPRCGTFQALLFSRIYWPQDLEKNDKLPDLIENKMLAFYRCEHCGHDIADRDRVPMLNNMRWQDAGTGGRRVGFRVNALASPWRTWSAAAAEFLRSKNDPPLLQNFRNSWLAEPFEVQISHPTTDKMASKVLPENAGPPDLVPAWASVLYASADVQGDHFWYAIRAWGYGLQSQLIRTGMLFTFDELYRVCLESMFDVAGGRGQMRCPVLVIDSGHRTDEVYLFATQRAPRVIPLKGASGRMDRPWRSTFLTPRTSGGSNVELRLIDTDFYKDMLARLIAEKMPDGGEKWRLHNQLSGEYLRQLSSEHKVLDRKSGRANWQPVTAGAANHAWDLEVYQCAAADMGNVGVIPPVAAAQPVQAIQPQPQRQQQDAFTKRFDEGVGVRKTGSGWLEGRGM